MNILTVPNVINDLPPIMTKEDRVALDVELFGLDPKKLHRPAGRFGSLACTNNGTDVYITYDENQVTEFLTRCQDAVWIFHNASFDVSHLRRWTKIEPRKRLWDTLLIEKIMYSGYYNNNEFGLNDLVRRYCDIYLEKTQQKQFNIDDEWTQEKIEYAAKDVVATWMIYWEQKKVIDEQSMEVYKQIDLPALWVTLGFMGVKVDTVKWIELANKNTGLAKEIGDDMDFNPRSPKQVVEALNNEGMDVISSGRRALERSDNETAQNVLKFRKFDKRANTYGEKWVEQFVEADGRVYASWQVSEAITGRMCVSGDTILETNMGSITISELDLTGTVKYDIITHKNRWKRIINKFYKGKEEMFLVTLDNGNQIKCTKKHKFLTSNGWKNLNEINNTDNILTP